MNEDQLVENHVLYCQTSLVEELFINSIIVDYTIYDKNILEWWLVTYSLSRWLREEGEVIIEAFGCYWWGRTCSGQAICQDSVISVICNK